MQITIYFRTVTATDNSTCSMCNHYRMVLGVPFPQEHYLWQGFLSVTSTSTFAS